MNPIAQLKILLSKYNIAFREIIRNETDINELPQEEFNITTLIINNQGVLWAIKIKNTTP
jgi:hypothetical protein